jgi:hypothetical protein
MKVNHETRVRSEIIEMKLTPLEVSGVSESTFGLVKMLEGLGKRVAVVARR